MEQGLACKGPGLTGLSITSGTRFLSCRENWNNLCSNNKIKLDIQSHITKSWVNSQNREKLEVSRFWLESSTFRANNLVEVSEKGRAARRASPTSTVDKANTSTKASDYSPNTAGTKDAGVSKKRTPTKRMTRAQRLRQEKGFERADRNIDVLQVKRTKSLVREKRTKDRAVRGIVRQKNLLHDADGRLHRVTGKI